MPRTIAELQSRVFDNSDTKIIGEIVNIVHSMKQKGGGGGIHLEVGVFSTMCNVRQGLYTPVNTVQM